MKIVRKSKAVSVLEVWGRVSALGTCCQRIVAFHAVFLHHVCAGTISSARNYDPLTTTSDRFLIYIILAVTRSTCFQMRYGIRR